MRAECPDCGAEVRVAFGAAVAYRRCSQCGVGHWWALDGGRLYVADLERESVAAAALMDGMEE